LRTIRHRNPLPILTAYSTIDNNGNDFRALIYEFMPNGNLDVWLHQKRGSIAPKLFGLAQRLSIGVGMADALAYIHHDCGRAIVHCDLKPTNILLDDDMNAKKKLDLRGASRPPGINVRTLLQNISSPAPHHRRLFSNRR